MARKLYPIGIQTFERIRKEDKFYVDKTEHPVLHFDMSLGKHMEKEQLERYLLHIIEEQERKFGIHNDKIDPNLRLKDLMKTVF